MTLVLSEAGFTRNFDKGVLSVAENAAILTLHLARSVGEDHTWRLIVSGDEIVGYWQFMCVKDDFYNGILEGSIVDSEMRVEMLDFPVVEGPYKAYLPVIAVRAQDRGATTLGLLLSALNKTLIDFAKNDILIEDFCATAFSFEGKRLCELIGMEYVHRHPRAPAGSLADVFRITGHSVPNSYLGKKSSVIREKYRNGFS
ncbi:MAG: hypothetical protein AAFQ15_10650 [Pseudomonadota bacterium]